jgi:hypothetical protein
VHLLRHLGLDRAGRDRVDADAGVAVFHRLLFGQVDQRGLGRAVGHAQGAGAQAGDGGDVDHRATAAFEHQRRAGLHAQERAIEVGRHHPAPFVEAGLADRLEGGDARVVDQGVEPAEGLFDALHGVGDLRRVGHVAVDDQQVALARTEFGAQRWPRWRPGSARRCRSPRRGARSGRTSAQSPDRCRGRRR